MTIKEKSIKILWAGSGGICAFEGCWERLCRREAKDVAPYPLGEMAHICGDKPGSLRYDASQAEEERNDPENLILLCPNHHTIVDRKENESIYTVDKLREMKNKHEEWVLQRLSQVSIENKIDVACAFMPLLEENKQSWEQYGPKSELAQKQPYNEAVYAMWLSERLSVIVPNNRNMRAVLEAHKNLFNANELKPITTFLMHVRSYERWVVQEGGDYATVKRFPVEFDELMRGLADECD